MDSPSGGRAGLAASPPGRLASSRFTSGWQLGLLDLGEVQLDRGGAAEDRDQHAQLLLLRLHLLDDAGEVGERAVDDADAVAALEADARLGLHGPLDLLALDRADVLLG